MNSEFTICITEEYDKDIDEKPYIAVSGKNGILNKDLSDFAHSEVTYSLALTDWKEWIGMLIDEKS